ALHLLLEEAGGPLTKQQFELVGTAKEDSERLLRTLNNLLDLTRLEESAPELNHSICTVEELVTAIADQQNNLNLKIEIENDLPSLFIDREKIDHVFSNFLTNARKHSNDDDPVIIRAQKLLDDQIRISIIDRGPGISNEHQERIFEKFYRVPGQASTGAGLGLSIAREIALLHRGNVGVISEPGNGCEFFIDLPAAHEDSMVA
ncbi:MAG TPA: sensor histidine kinase, partial [Opitutales bacterium]|nr:sensor histidine kinase [Opitutales bacterium]